MPLKEKKMNKKELRKMAYREAGFRLQELIFYSDGWILEKKLTQKDRETLIGFVDEISIELAKKGDKDTDTDGDTDGDTE
jgi:hypothetical protein